MRLLRVPLARMSPTAAMRAKRVTDPHAYSVYSLIAPTIQFPPGFVVVRNEKSHRRLGDKLYGTVKALIRRQLANCRII